MSELKPTKGERTRRLLLDRVIALVHTRPLAEVKIGDICAAAGVATGAFYFHFESRDDALVTRRGGSERATDSGFSAKQPKITATTTTSAN